MCDIDNNKDYAVKVTNLTKIYKIYKKPWHRIVNVIKNVNYKKFYALDNVSVTFPKGEAIGILGINGSGKSTLLKMITGVTTPTEGSIEVNGRISAMLELTSGFDKELTGLENIHLKAVSTGIPEEFIEAKIEEIAEFADIGDYLYQPVRTYSSGMKARLGFSINVNVDPDILIIDEVLAVGDDTFKIKCLSKMEEFRKKGKTILFVSHNLTTVEGFCTKSMWIKEGKLQAYDDTGIVVQMYQDYLKERRKAQKIKKLESEEGEAEILTKRDIVSYPEVKMMDLSINHKRRNVFKYNSTITVKIKYEVKVAVDSLICAFTIRDNEGNEIYSSDKAAAQNRVNSEIGVHEVRITLNSLKLLPGTYKFGGALWNNEAGMPIWFYFKKPFIVESDSFVGTGVVKMDYEIEQIEEQENNVEK